MNNSDEPFLIKTSLKNLFDKMVTYLKKYKEDKVDESNLANLVDDSNLVTIIETLDNTFVELMTNVNDAITNMNDTYDQLERILQKYEGEIRNHIRIEQQLKLYSESLQTKLDDFDKNKEDWLNETKTALNSVKKENQKLAESLKQTKEINENLLNQIKSLEELNQKYEQQLETISLLQDKIKKMEKIAEYQNQQGQQQPQFNMPKLIYNHNQSKEFQNIKKLNLEVESNRSGRSHSLGKSTNSGNSVVASTTPLKIFSKQSPILNNKYMPNYEENIKFHKAIMEMTDTNNNSKQGLEHLIRMKQIVNQKNIRHSSFKKSRDNISSRTVYSNFPVMLGNMSSKNLIGFTEENQNNPNNNNNGNNANPINTNISLKKHQRTLSQLVPTRSSTSKLIDIENIYAGKTHNNLPSSTDPDQAWAISNKIVSK